MTYVCTRQVILIVVSGVNKYSFYVASPDWKGAYQAIQGHIMIWRLFAEYKSTILYLSTPKKERRLPHV